MYVVWVSVCVCIHTATNGIGENPTRQHCFLNWTNLLSNGNRMQIPVDEKVLQTCTQCCEFISSERSRRIKCNYVHQIGSCERVPCEANVKFFLFSWEVYCHDRTGNIIKSPTAAWRCVRVCICSYILRVLTFLLPCKHWNSKIRIDSNHRNTFEKTQTSD